MIEPDSTHISPDGRVRIDYRSEEMRMSHWIDVPYVTEVASGRRIFAPPSSMVSGHHEWGEDGHLRLYLRKYPDGGSGIGLTFDIDAGTVRVDGEEQSHPITDAGRIVDRHFTQYRARPPGYRLPAPQSRPPPISDLWRTGWGRVKLVLYILLFAFVVATLTGLIPFDRWTEENLAESVRTSARSLPECPPKACAAS